MPDEYSVLAYYNGNAEEAHKTTSIIINSPVFQKITKGEQDRILKNLDFYKKAIDRNTEEEPKAELQES